MDTCKPWPRPWSRNRRAIKRAFDLSAALAGLAGLAWLLLVLWALATLDTGRNGFFRQVRVGRRGRLFRIFKIRTMRDLLECKTNVTTRDDPRITRLGSWLRRTKLDELPQLLNILIGDMSFVGPRPDVEEYAELLQEEDRVVLAVRPGLTGPATLHFRDEEELLATREDPVRYNREVIFPEKVRLNCQYIRDQSLGLDLGYILSSLKAGWL